MPPRIIRLADDVVRNVVGVQFVEEFFGALKISAAVNVNHDFRTRIVPAPGINAIYARIN